MTALPGPCFALPALLLMSLWHTQIALAVEPRPEPKLLSLANAYQTALQNNAGLQRQRVALQRARLLYRLDSKTYTSDIAFETQWSQQSANVSGTGSSLSNDSQDRLFMQLTWRFPWWHKEWTKDNAAKSEIGIALEKHRLEIKKRGLQLDIFQAYLNVALLRKKREVAHKRQAFAHSRREMVSKSFQLGNVSELALIIERSNLLDQQAKVIDLDATVRRKYQRLFELMGIPPKQVSVQEKILQFFSFDPATLVVTQALQFQTGEIALQLMQQRIELRKKNRTWKPSLGVRVAYSPESQSLGNTSGSQLDQVRSIGLVLKVPIPDISHQKADIALTNHDLEVLQNQMLDRIKRTRSNFHKLSVRIIEASQRIDLLMSLVEAKRAEAKASQQSFEIGKMTNLALQLVEGKVDDAQSRYYDALFEYLSTIATLRHLQGISLIASNNNAQ